MRVEEIGIPGCPGGTPVAGPTRIILHSTEGSWDGSISAYRANRSAPHLQVRLPSTGGFRVARFIPFNRSAYAVRNESGGVETNRFGQVIQIEIVMFAGRAKELTDADYEKLGEVLAWVKQQVGDKLNLNHFHKTKPYPESYGKGNGIRLSFDHWRVCNGVVCHMHVPENDHGDPGAVDIERVIEYATGGEMSAKDVKSINTVSINQGRKTRKAILASERRQRQRELNTAKKVNAAREEIEELQASIERLTQELAREDEQAAKALAAVEAGEDPPDDD